MNLNNIINILNHQTLWFFSKKVGLKLFKPTFSSLTASQMLGVYPLSYISIVLTIIARSTTSQMLGVFPLSYISIVLAIITRSTSSQMLGVCP